MPSAASAARARSHCTRCAGRRETVGPGARTPTLAAHSRLALVERGAVSHRRLRPLIAASLLVLIVPAAASAAPAGDVSIRVEGSTATLAGPAVVRTVDGAFTKAAAAGPPATCSSTSIGGALETLTAGGWNGTNGSVGMSLETILGETHLFTSDAYWNLYVNDAPASMGICTQELSPGDRVLVAPSCTGRGHADVLLGRSARARRACDGAARRARDAARRRVHGHLRLGARLHQHDDARAVRGRDDHRGGPDRHDRRGGQRDRDARRERRPAGVHGDEGRPRPGHGRRLRDDRSGRRVRAGPGAGGRPAGGHVRDERP